MQIAVDFDRTLFTYGKGFAIGEPIPQSRETLADLRARGNEISIFSARSNREHTDPPATVAVESMLRALQEHRVPYDRVELGYDGKPLADLFIDDKSLGVPLMIFREQIVVDWSGVRGLLFRYGIL